MRNGSVKGGGSRAGRKIAWLLLLIVVLVSIAAVAIPVFVIMPFKAQSERGLELSYLLRRWSPLVTVAAALVVLALVVWLWRNSRRWWRKSALILAFALSLITAWFSHQNHFEWMFNPLPQAGYVKAGEASFVDDSDMVIAVETGGESVAYPVRQMAYHHLVQDSVGGTPLVATY